MTAPADGQARLNYYINARLDVLHMTRDELERRGGPARCILHTAIDQSRAISPTTLSRIDEALGWSDGSSRAILGGGVPSAHQATVCARCKWGSLSGRDRPARIERTA